MKSFLRKFYGHHRELIESCEIIMSVTYDIGYVPILATTIPPSLCQWLHLRMRLIIEFVLTMNNMTDACYFWSSICLNLPEHSRLTQVIKVSSCSFFSFQCMVLWSCWSFRRLLCITKCYNTSTFYSFFGQFCPALPSEETSESNACITGISCNLHSYRNQLIFADLFLCHKKQISYSSFSGK